MNKQEEITDILTPQGIKKILVGQVLIFKDKNKRIDLKITEKIKNRVWAQKIKTYSVGELAIAEKESNEKK